MRHASELWSDFDYLVAGAFILTIVAVFFGSRSQAANAVNQLTMTLADMVKTIMTGIGPTSQTYTPAGLQGWKQRD